MARAFGAPVAAIVFEIAMRSWSSRSERRRQLIATMIVREFARVVGSGLRRGASSAPTRRDGRAENGIV